MRWGEGRRSDNVEDRRGIRVSRGMVGGGVGTLVLVLVSLYLGIDPTILLQQAPPVTGPPAGTSREARPPEENKMADFISVVLADTEDTWNELFRQGGAAYREPKLVLFTDAVESACGFAESAVGDFAQAYVIAHEVGHHVQNLLGISEKVQNARARVSQVEGNRLSVRLELQADCLAGVWAFHANRARNIIETGDVEEALV
jgi:predicted metalloprotease